ncbi:hypothetical protein B0H11DRAFT_1249638 [Mycena galericulata]|nr:hypothetical protein B0H11DRAFT_1249638 [Mycena galericulata]
MFPSATTSYMVPAERVRRQWHAFEQWVDTVPRVAMEKEIAETSQNMDAKWTATPARNRSSKQDHEKNKTAFRRELEDGLVTLAREEWQRRLEQAGLRDEDWGEMTFKETLAAERLLGGDLDEEGMAIMESVARAEDDAGGAHALPGLTNVTRATNFSGYSFVSPMSLSIADDLDDDTFESIFPFEIPTSSGPESIASITDEIFDTPTSVPWGWRGDSSSYGVWSADTSQSSRQSSQTGSPERPPKPSLREQTSFPRPTEPGAPHQPESRASAAHRTRLAGPRYIGPQLTDPDPDDVLGDEEAAFERFKMETRVAKIREFHDEAARADIQLAQDISDARKTSRTWRADEPRRIAEHEARMCELRRVKEEERKEVVRAERHKRREAIRLRGQLRVAAVAVAVQTPTTAMGWGAAESPRQRLTQEVESNLLKMGGAPEPPVVPSAETRHERRQSLTTTMSASYSQPPPPPTRTAKPQPGRASQADWMAASVSDLLEAPPSISIASSTSSASSSQIHTTRPQVWIPPVEIVKAAPPKPVLKNTPLPPVVDPVASLFTSISAVATKQQPSLWPASSSSETSSTSSTGEPAPAVAAASKATNALPKKPVVSNANASKSSSKSQSPPAPAPSKVPSPPVASKVTSPQVSSKVSSPPAGKGPSPPVPVKGASQTISKGQTPSKAPIPPTAKGATPPTISKGPALTKAPSPPASTIVTPKPSDPPAPPPTSKKARVQAQAMEIQTPGASSSRTTLEQMQRPFIHKSLGSASGVDLWMAPPPQMGSAAPSVWVSSSSAAKKADSAKAPSSFSGSHSTQIDKAPSMPPQRLPLLAETIRPRRMSDPVSPSPRSFAFVDNAEVTADDLPSAFRKPKASKQKSKRVTVEEVSDEEDADSLEKLPVDSKVIFEPKPSVPTTMFSHIIDFTSDTPKPPTVAEGRAQAKHPPVPSTRDNTDGFLTSDGKSAKEKHVRWTPSALGSGNGSASPATSRSSLVETDNTPRAAVQETVPAPKGRRGRTSSLLQPATGVVERKGKGKGKERAVEPETEADFARFVMGATQDLTQARGL